MFNSAATPFQLNPQSRRIHQYPYYTVITPVFYPIFCPLFLITAPPPPPPTPPPPPPPPTAGRLTCRKKTYDYSEQNKTTVMIKNIPNYMSKEVLIAYLDEHCAQENTKIVKIKKEDSSEYDFLYLPMDFRRGSKSNLGYAFVNFTTAIAAVRFYCCYNGYKWEDFVTDKICEVRLARIQGREKLVKKFKYSIFRCHSDEFLPTVFTPPRNGEQDATTATSVGRRCFQP